MSKPKPTKTPAAKEKASPQPRRARFLLHILGFFIFIGGLGFITIQTKKYVEQEAAGPPATLRIALVNKPVWMSDYLADQIAQTIPKNSSSAFDHDLLVRVAEKLKQNPWVAQVHQVRRVYGQQPGDTLQIDCEFRAPIALVKFGSDYLMVDNDAVVLPEQFSADHLDQITVGRDGRTSLRIVQGVHASPPKPGHKWAGQDLAAGLELVKLFYGKLFLDEVTTIDVGNYAGRIKRSDPQLVLDTRYGSQVWWGRPLNTKDFFVEVSPQRKLEILRAVVQQHGRIDANQAYVDVRYDDFLIPTTQPSNQPGNQPANQPDAQARTVDDPSR